MSTNFNLDVRAADTLQRMARGPEGAVLREYWLKPWLEAIVSRMSTAQTSQLQTLQGELQVVHRLMEVLNPNPKARRTRTLIVGGEPVEVPLSHPSQRRPVVS